MCPLSECHSIFKFQNWTSKDKNCQLDTYDLNQHFKFLIKNFLRTNVYWLTNFVIMVNIAFTLVKYVYNFFFSRCNFLLFKIDSKTQCRYNWVFLDLIFYVDENWNNTNFVFCNWILVFEMKPHNSPWNSTQQKNTDIHCTFCQNTRHMHHKITSLYMSN